ncbi:hypothetical protein GALL_312800 [mine drainage metagenome]|uniref:Uncharacterized protein n=1 Tax=mine drainage metagenome TaxID=410659 RepID=A0A1J5QT92_9ZZZZ
MGDERKYAGLPCGFWQEGLKTFEGLLALGEMVGTGKIIDFGPDTRCSRQYNAVTNLSRGEPTLVVGQTHQTGNGDALGLQQIVQCTDQCAIKGLAITQGSQVSESLDDVGH